MSTSLIVAIVLTFLVLTIPFASEGQFSWVLISLGVGFVSYFFITGVLSLAG